MTATASRRRPRLRVVGGQARPRHQVSFSVDGTDPKLAVEFWSEREWEALADHERPEPDTTVWLPAVGFFHVRGVTQAESEEIAVGTWRA